MPKSVLEFGPVRVVASRPPGAHVVFKSLYNWVGKIFKLKLVHQVFRQSPGRNCCLKMTMVTLRNSWFGVTLCYLVPMSVSRFFGLDIKKPFPIESIYLGHHRNMLPEMKVGKVLWFTQVINITYACSISVLRIFFETRSSDDLISRQPMVLSGPKFQRICQNLYSIVYFWLKLLYFDQLLPSQKLT